MGGSARRKRQWEQKAVDFPRRLEQSFPAPIATCRNAPLALEADLSPRLSGLFDRVAETTALAVAFTRVKANAGVPGGDGVSIADFERRLAREIPALVEELILGTYVPRRARGARIPKDGGGFRDLTIPAVRDRVVQSAAAALLMDGLDPEWEDSSFGYRRGRSVEMAVRMVDKHRRDGLRWVVDADIRSYFDSVPHDRLIRRLQDHVDDGPFVDLISLWLEAYGEAGRGLPQGSPVSPVLANLYLDVLDEAIEDRKTKIVRYADDFVILTLDAAAAEAARDKAARLLQREGLELHPDKTRIVPFDRGFRFLGRLFVRSIVIEDPWDEAPPVAAVPPAAEAEDGRDRSGRPSRLRRVLYLVTEGTRLSLGTGEAIEVSEDGRPRLRLKAHMIERVEVHPGVDVDIDALRALLLARVPVVFVDPRGEPLGGLGPRPGPNTELHLAQAAVVLDGARRRLFAEAIVAARIHNHRALLRRLNRGREKPEVVQACEAINRVLRKLPQAEGVASLMSYEGQSAKAYWAVLGQLLPEGWAFHTRQRRPPRTAFDSVLSFLSTLVTNDVERAVNMAGLHPGFAVLHTSKAGEFACATDLVEEFRGPVAEACAVTLCAQKVVKASGFADDPKLGVRPDPATREAILRGYERWLARPVKDPGGSSDVPWRNLIERQARRFSAAILGGEAYRPYRMDY